MATLNLLNPKQFVCSELINIKEYFEEYSQSIDKVFQPNATNPSDHEPENPQFPNLVLSKEAKQRLELECSLDKLSHEGEVPQTDDVRSLWKKSDFSNSTGVPGKLNVTRLKNRYSKCRAPIHMFNVPPNPKVDSDDSQENNLIPYKDAVVIIRVYKQFIGEATVKSKYNLKCMFEIAILLQNTLAELRDKIKCTSDLGFCKPLDYPEFKLDPSVKEEYPSGFIFIENCFYNDMRNESAIDYSKTIRDWAKSKHKVDYKTGNIDTTKIGDLKIRIGYPYLYQHQATCEHVFVFSEMRLMREEEPLSSTFYPYYISFNKFNAKKCLMCKSPANFIITNCERLPNSLNLMCERCVISYNYKNNEKIGDFMLYPYYDFDYLS